MLFAVILSFTNLSDGVDIFWHHKIPITESFTQNFGGIPAEQTFSSRRPTQNPKLVIPLNDSQRSILHMKSETVSLHRGCFCALTIGNVTNDGNAPNNFAVFIVSRRV